MEENSLDVRKLIKFGNSSFVVSLPSNWIRNHELKKGDSIYLNENEKKELILAASNARKLKETKKATIDVNNKPIDRIKREIISAYVSGHGYFVLNGNLKDYTEEIERTLHNLMGLEIVEQTSNKTIVRDFLNTEEVLVGDIFRRIDLIIRSMIGDSKNCFSNQLYKQVNHRDITVNKLRFLLLRMINESRHSPNVMNAIENSGMNAYEAWLLLINLEDIADSSRRIARLLKDKKFEDKELEGIITIYNQIESSYLQVMKALYKKDKELAHNIADNKFSIIDDCDKLFKKTKNKWTVAIIEKLKEMESYVRNISRIVIDQEMRSLSNNKP
ncbi:hypothetical protein J4413_03570 [Candidatus Woesearchaeota archaeon]|nr:hypothetical protein [Candidatus Woesearchaeota archaeon]